MQATPSPARTTRALERLLALLGALASLLLCLRIWQTYSPMQPMWPFPALYLLETLLLSLLGAFLVWKQDPRGLIPLWSCVGLLFGLMILGVWSIGFGLAPSFILLLLAAALSDLRNARNILPHLAVTIAAALLQALLMLLIVYTSSLR